MRKLLLIGLSISVVLSVEAQNWNEWFQQNKTQRKYLLQQIAALKVHATYIREGYEIATRGLQTIYRIKNGDFNLHNDFFNSLLLVNPAIKQLAEVVEIVKLQRSTIREANHVAAFVANCNEYSLEEIRQFKKILDGQIGNCKPVIHDLVTVITSGSIEMKDGERIGRIKQLLKEMQELTADVKQFSGYMYALSMERRRSKIELEFSNRLNGLK